MKHLKNYDLCCQEHSTPAAAEAGGPPFHPGAGREQAVQKLPRHASRG